MLSGHTIADMFLRRSEAMDQYMLGGIDVCKEALAHLGPFRSPQYKSSNLDGHPRPKQQVPVMLVPSLPLMPQSPSCLISPRSV